MEKSCTQPKKICLGGQYYGVAHPNDYFTKMSPTKINIDRIKFTGVGMVMKCEINTFMCDFFSANISTIIYFNITVRYSHINI